MRDKNIEEDLKKILDMPHTKKEEVREQVKWDYFKDIIKQKQISPVHPADKLFIEEIKQKLEEATQRGQRIKAGDSFINLYKEKLQENPLDKETRKKLIHLHLQRNEFKDALLEVEELYNIATGKVRPYILAGDITHFPLTYIFVLIQKTKKSGKLTIKIKDYEEIEIFFIQGVMVHAVDKESKGEEVVRKAIKLRKGHFIFDSETVTFELTIKRPLESIIQDDKPEK